MNFFLLSIFLLLSCTPPVRSNAELNTLLQIKAALDPHGSYLSSWTVNGDPCGGNFLGVACNELGRVANISLQGKGLDGFIPPAIGGLKSLSGLYLHFNRLSGEIPREISGLTQLSDLYLNVNNLSGGIPQEIGSMSGLQVLQLCYNGLSGSVPTQLGSLKNLNVLALQYNHLTGAIPASLGNLNFLTRLDLSFNRFFGSIPVKVAEAPSLRILDVRNNTLSGIVPFALHRLNDGFQYENNPALCGAGFASLRACTNSDTLNQTKPDAPNTTKERPKSATLPSNCTQMSCLNPRKHSHAGVISGVLVIGLVSVVAISMFLWYRRRKQQIGSSENRLQNDLSDETGRSIKGDSPLMSLEYPTGWDPLSKGSREALESFMFNLEDVQYATQHFSEVNFLGRSSYSAVYKGVLRDGSMVAVKRIAKTSCKSNESEFLKGLKVLTVLQHGNLVGLRGFCWSKGRRECLLVYDFVPNGNLLQYLDSKGERVLDWPTRVSIIKGIAKGLDYLHTPQGSKPSLPHQNLSAEKVLLDWRFNPQLLGSGLHKLLADDIVFSMLKASAAMGYLAPEYTTTGKFTDKSDIYAFGMIMLQILSGKTTIDQSIRQGAELGDFESFVDTNLGGKYSELEAAKLGKIAFQCIHELPHQRPTIHEVRQELSLIDDSS